jgi:hypothetical protein
MFLAFLKSPFYDRIARMTQYRDPYYGSDSDNDYDSDSDEESQYQMVRIYDDVLIQYENTNNPVEKQYKSDFHETDYYFVYYENTDTVFERRFKDCLNYGAVGVCLITYILIVYVIMIIYT